jgi:tungstate transport system substrate-binding protein
MGRLLLPALLALATCGRRPVPSIILATTTSTRDSGLLDVLVPRFTKQNGIEVKVIAVGSGAALDMAGRGDADVVLAHAPSAEKKYVEAGDLVDGKLIMHNSFVLLGPPEDPAGVKRSTDVKSAFAAIARAGGFASRGDDSGTHKKEQDLWKAAGVDPKTVTRRVETGQGMGATLKIADEKGLYTLSDRGTYLAWRARLRLTILHQGDKTLLNVYHAYLVNPARHRGVKAEAGRRFLDFLVEAQTQRTIGEFGRKDHGEPLFVPDAGKDPTTLGLK